MPWVLVACLCGCWFYSTTHEFKASMRPETVRMAVLVTLVVQNSAQALFMRYAFKPKELVEGEEPPPHPASSTAVLLAEITKFACSWLLQYREDGSLRNLRKSLREDLWDKPLDLLKMAVPACLYVVQNNLNYIAARNLEGPTYQLMYQLKILTTALFSVVMLKRVLVLKQWLALAMLALGVGLVQISSVEDKGEDKNGDGDGDDAGKENPFLGLVAVLSACCTSGFAGVYFEKVLKGTSVSLWIRNLQLSGFGILIGAGAIYIKDWESVSNHGFFYGYDFAAWMSVALNSLGGLVVAMVVKYADNVVKGFATSLSILLTALVSVVLFGFSITVMFLVGAYLVLHATYLYSQKPPTAAVAAPAAPAAPSDVAAGNTSKGEVEITEKRPLLEPESSASPRTARAGDTTLPRKNGNSGSGVARASTPV